MERGKKTLWPERLLSDLRDAGNSIDNPSSWLCMAAGSGAGTHVSRGMGIRASKGAKNQGKEIHPPNHPPQQKELGLALFKTPSEGGLTKSRSVTF